MAQAEGTALGLQVTLRRVGDVSILDLRGRATIGLGNDLLSNQLRQLIDGGWKKILVNLGAVAQIDSSGISTLVRTFVTLQRTGGSLKLLSPAGRVKEVLELTRLLNSMPHFDNEVEAVASFK